VLGDIRQLNALGCAGCDTNCCHQLDFKAHQNRFQAPTPVGKHKASTNPKVSEEASCPFQELKKHPSFKPPPVLSRSHFKQNLTKVYAKNVAFGTAVYRNCGVELAEVEYLISSLVCKRHLSSFWYL